MLAPRYGPFITLVLVAALGLVACKSRGPGRVASDRFDYNRVVGESNNEQMLLNLVRMRYRDVPTFLGVSSVLTQYVYAGFVGAEGVTGTSAGADLDTLGVQGNFRYIERPTVTYSPMTGPEFTEQLLTPIPGGLLFSLLESGWPAEELLAMGLDRINGIRNVPFRVAPDDPQTETSPELDRVVELLIALSERGAVEVVGREQAGNETLVVVDGIDAETDAYVAEFRRLLGLAPDVSRYRIVHRRTGLAPDEMTVRMRSIVALMGYLSSGVDIPPEHVESELMPVEGDATADVSFPMRILSSAEAPTDAFVAIRYRDAWFYIENADLRSREAFGLVVYLFTMMAPSIEAQAPLVTVPTG